jgi:hypothetical protein
MAPGGHFTLGCPHIQGRAERSGSSRSPRAISCLLFIGRDCPRSLGAVPAYVSSAGTLTVSRAAFLPAVHRQEMSASVWRRFLACGSSARNRGSSKNERRGRYGSSHKARGVEGTLRFLSNFERCRGLGREMGKAGARTEGNKKVYSFWRIFPSWWAYGLGNR